VISKIPVILCVDTEPNEIFIDPSSPLPWTGFEAGVRYFRGLEAPVEISTKSPLHVSWFFRMDAQIEKTYGSASWAVENYSGAIDTLVKRGDELALHTHGYRWDEGLFAWVIDHGNWEAIRHSIELSFKAYKKVFGKNCRSFRFGDRWMNAQSIALLERLGVLYDLTPEPGYGSSPTLRGNSPFTGVIPDYTDFPRTPYRPSLSDLKKPDTSKKEGLWFIPLSTGAVRHPYAKRHQLFYSIFNPAKLASFNLALHMELDPDFFWQVVDGLLQTLPAPYLAFGTRSHIFLSKEKMRNIDRNFEILFTRAKTTPFFFATPAEAMKILEDHVDR